MIEYGSIVTYHINSAWLRPVACVVFGVMDYEHTDQIMVIGNDEMSPVAVHSSRLTQTGGVDTVTADKLRESYPGRLK